MDANLVNGIFNNGTAIGLIVVGVLFFYFKAWPWYTKRVESFDTERKERHAEYMGNMRNNTAAIERLGDISESFALSITSIGSEIKANHADLVSRLDALKKLRDTGPLGK